MRAVTRMLSLILLAMAAMLPPKGSAWDQSHSRQSVFTANPGQGTFLVLSDLHFDPFADVKLFPRLLSASVGEWESIFRSSGSPAFSQYGSDSNYALLSASLEAAREYGSKEHYDYVVVTGDYLAHNFELKFRQAGGKDDAFAAFVTKTMLFVARMVQQAFPALPVYGSLGNNDSICGDYRLTPGGPFLASVAREWKTVAANHRASHDFAVGGYYAVPHPTVPKHELIVLNSTFWSASYQNACAKTPGDPGKAELDWLTHKLQQLQREKKKATLIMHIPPGVDGYTSARSGKCDHAVNLWNPAYTSAFSQTVETYKDLLRDGFAGHMHMDDFRVVAAAAGAPVLEMHVVPAVSAVYNNNPAFEIGLYDRTSGNLTDYAIVYLGNLADLNGPSRPGPLWSVEYTVNAEYHISQYGPDSARHIADGIRSDAATREQYMKLYAVQSPRRPSVNQDNWRFYSCAQTEIPDSAFVQCSCGTAGAK